MILAEVTEKYAKENTCIMKKELRKIKNKKDIDIDSVKRINDSLLKEMNTLSVAENENGQIVADIKRILLKA